MKAKAALDARKDKEQMADTTYQNELKKIKAGEIDGQKIQTMTIIIKATNKATYKNVIDALDEMQICSVGKYVLDKISPDDAKLLKSKGISMIYITHRLTEVFEIATDVAIMRDGVITLRGPVEEFDKEMLIRGLLPTDAEMQESGKTAYVPVPYDKLKPVMEVRNLSGYGFSDISFDLYPGEILGIAGVVGAGRTELISTIFGRDKVLGGTVKLNGRDITGLPTVRILKEGINFVPEDRHYHGLFKIRSICSNTTSALLSTDEIGRVNMNRKRQSEISQKYVDEFRTKIVSLEDLIGSLSGGNQQKVVIARSLSTNPKVVILDEPTRGIDAAARGDVYNIIHQLKDTGVAVLMVSSDIEEVVELADRAVTVFQGRINGEFRHDEITQDVLTGASFGIAQKNPSRRR